MEKTRISIFYDGYAFKLTSDFYKFGHPLQRRINFNGLDAYIQNKTAEAIGVNEKDCAVVGRHLYMGVSAGRDVTPEQAKKDSDFRDLLKHSNITGHFRDLQTNEDGSKREKMVDSDLISDALEMAFKHEFDVLVLIARDKDFVPLLEKLNKLAIPSVLFWWDIPEYKAYGITRKPQRTADILIQSVTHNFEMSIIADKRKKTELEENIFHKAAGYPVAVNPPNQQSFQRPNSYQSEMPVSGRIGHTSTAVSIDNLVMNTAPRELTLDELEKTWESTIISINLNGYGGYIKGPVKFSDPALNNFQFSSYDIGDRHITDLKIGMKVQFRLKPDPKRSEQLKHTLYRACNITLCDVSPVLRSA